MAVCSKEAEKCVFDLCLSNVTFSRAAKYVLVGSDAQQRIKVATQTLLQSRVKLFCLVLSYHKVYLDIWITSKMMTKMENECLFLCKANCSILILPSDPAAVNVPMATHEQL